MLQLARAVIAGFAGFAAAGCGQGTSPSGEHAPPEAEDPAQEARSRRNHAGTAKRGKYYPIRRKQLNARQERQVAELEALGYASGGEEATDVVGVTFRHPELSLPGQQFLVSGHAPVAILMDEGGEVLHEWRCRAEEAFPAVDPSVGQREFWRRARLLPDGEVIAIFENLGLVCLDRDSQVLWTYTGLVHHDIDLDADGNIWVLARQGGLVEWLDRERPVLDDLIVKLDPSGRELDRMSVMECIARSPLKDAIEGQLLANHAEKRAEEEAYREKNKELFERNPEKLELLNFTGDVFHSNTLQWLDGSNAEGAPQFSRGHILLCIRNLGRVVTMDPEERSVTWSMPGIRPGLHEPVLLDSGNVLLFDNHGPKHRENLDGVSEILEVQPATGDVMWSYRAEPARAFYSSIAGSVQRLANGNTLITESTAGRAFEVLPDGRIVWEFLTPYRAGADGQLVAFLPELQRVSADWLDR